MHRMIYGTICCLFILLVPCVTSYGGWFSRSDDILVTIDDTEYSADDFRSWWSNWREPGMSPPDSTDPFIDWMLLLREAERMRLHEDQEYRKKVLVFLKARTLMLLKAEEVNDRIEIGEEDLWKRYRELYAPLMQINILFFHTREDADNFLKETGAGPIGDDRLAGFAPGENGLLKIETGWYRKATVDPGWHDILSGLEQGKLSEPVDWMQGVVILRLQERKEGDRDDFETVRKQIYSKLFKERENYYTIELLKKLREQYHVRIDRERLEKLDISAPDDSFSDEPIVTTDNGTVSEKDFMVQVRRMQNIRQKSGFTNDEGFQYKEQVLNGIINQTLTTWESLARGYEKKSPFKEVYTFYCQNRMIKALENRMFTPEVHVSNDEVEKYYEEHIEEYTRPAMVRLVSAEGSPEDMKALWTAVAMGGDFRAAARERFDINLPVREIPADHLSGEVREVVEKLTRNELSSVFTVNDRASLVQLIERIPAQPIPLSKVGRKIQEQLYTERMDTVRRNYLEKLRAGSTIAVNSEVWQQLRTEMEQGDAEKAKE